MNGNGILLTCSYEHTIATYDLKPVSACNSDSQKAMEEWEYHFIHFQDSFNDTIPNFTILSL
jgi:hypothetical protein